MSDLHGIASAITGDESSAQMAAIVRNHDEDACIDIALKTLAAIAEEGCGRVRDARQAARSTLLLIDVIRGDRPITAID